jgi:hypothetical protein
MGRQQYRPFTTSALFGLLRRVLPEHVLFAFFGRPLAVRVEARRRR